MTHRGTRYSTMTFCSHWLKEGINLGRGTRFPGTRFVHVRRMDFSPCRATHWDNPDSASDPEPCPCPGWVEQSSGKWDICDSEPESGILALEASDMQPQRGRLGRKPLIVEGKRGVTKEHEPGIVATVMEEPCKKLRSWIQSTGSPVEKDFAAAMQVLTNPTKHYKAKLDKLVNHMVGDTPRPTMPIVAEAKFLGMDHRVLLQDMNDLGAALFVASRTYASSWASHLAYAIDTGVLEGDAQIRMDTYDETTMVLRVLLDQIERKNIIGGHKAIMDTVDNTSEKTRKGRKESGRRKAQLVKLFQCDTAILWLCSVKKSGRKLAIWVPLLWPVQAADRKTAKVVADLKKNFWKLSLVDAVQSKFKFSLDLTIADQASEINQAEKELSEIWHEISRWRNGCFAHVVHTASAKGCDATHDTIRYLVHFALAQRPGGSVGKLRQVAAEVIFANVNIVHGTPPSETGPWARHRDLILDLLCPKTKKGSKDKLYLQHLLKGNIEIERIDVWRLESDTRTDEVIAKDFAAELADFVIPGILPVIQVQRWLTALQPISQASLMFEVHQLAQWIIPRWILLLRGKKLQPFQRTWIDDLHPEFQNLDEEISYRPPNGGAKKVAFDWSKYNLCQQAGAAKLAFSPSSGGDLIVARICLDVFVRLTNKLLQVETQNWLLKQTLEARQGGTPLRGRGQYARSRILTFSFFKDVSATLTDTGMWEALQPKYRTMEYSNKGFSLLSRGGAVIFQLMHMVLSRFPWTLFDVLSGDLSINDIKGLCADLLDSCAKKILKHFNTLPQTKDLCFLLAVLDVIIQITSLKPECAHAAFRRGLRARSQTQV